MELLFNIIDTSEDHKVSNTEFGKYFSTLSANTEWPIIEPYLRTATKSYLIPYLGMKFYDKILQAKDGILIEVLDELKSAAAYYTIFDAMPFVNLIMSGTGVHQNMPNNAAPSTLWSFDKARWNAIVNADKALDRALNLLVDNIDDEEISDFKSSKYYKKSSTDFFRGKDEFAAHVQVDNFKAYLAMIPDIKKAEKDLYDQICSDQLAESLESEDKIDQKLIELCQAALAEKTIALALPHLNVYMDKDGLIVMSSVDGMENSRIGVFSKNNNEAIQTLVDRVEQDYYTSIKRVYNYLYKNMDHFTTWKSGLDKKELNSKVISLKGCEGTIFL